MRKQRKLWVPILVCVLIAAAIAAGILIWRSRNTAAVEVYPVETVYTTYWGDSSTLDGYVSTGKVQNVALREGLIESINVSVGDTVSAGDVLMVYDTTSFQLTLQSDQARIGLLESNIALANRNLASYKTLRPAEEAPQPTEEIIDHGELILRETIGEDDYTGGDLVFQCSGDTVVTAAFLRQLRAAGAGAAAEFQLYEDGVLYGSWIVDGGDESLQPYTVEFETQVTVTVPGDPSGEEDGAESSAEVTQTVTVSKEFDPIQDWTLGVGLSFTGDGVSLSLGRDSVCFGRLVSCTPAAYERYETVYHDSFVYDGSDNYLYTRAELAQMIKQTEEEIAALELDLKAAQLTYQQDQLAGETGEIVAAISGTVTEVKDAAALSAGETLLTVKGTENYTITAYISEMNLSKLSVGDSLSVYTYETGSSVTATISEISETPASGSYGWGNENPNNSYYSITATVDDPDAELSIGEWCEVTLTAEDEEAGGVYLPLMYVRKDSGGYYVMLAGENDRLTKQYVPTGKTLWGYYIEVKAGVTLEDRIAFPYGKTVKEGASVQDAEYPADW